MLKRLESDAAKADLAAVEALLGDRSPEEDPVGYLQFSKRAEALTRRIEELESVPSTGAEVGLFFGGRPVVGSHGILAEFGAKAVAEFQNLVSSAYAAVDGALGARGPVPQRDRTQLLITDVARGSFGFILQQADAPQLVDSPLKGVLSHSLDLLFRAASPDQEAFDRLAETVDGRVLASLCAFFKLVDDAGATVRLVEGGREFTLRREDVELARERTEHVSFEENEQTIEGALYVLPDAGRFELHRVDGKEVFRGVIAPDCLADLTIDGHEVRPGVIGAQRTVRLLVRETRAKGRDARLSYTLISVGYREPS